MLNGASPHVLARGGVRSHDSTEAGERDHGRMLIRIEGTNLPGRECGPGPDFPDGHHNIHVAVQGRKGQQDLFGLIRADAPSAHWDLACEIFGQAPTIDFKGPQIQGSPTKRFIYLTWGVVDTAGAFTMFRRAKLWLDAIPSEIVEQARPRGVLNGRLGLSDDHGRPLCASVRPPLIRWSPAGT